MSNRGINMNSSTSKVQKNLFKVHNSESVLELVKNSRDITILGNEVYDRVMDMVLK